MKFVLTITCNNAAFHEYDTPSCEVARILHELAKRIDGHPHFSIGHSQPVYDINGNEVGCFIIGKETPCENND
jgi:hypothetical protein